MPATSAHDYDRATRVDVVAGDPGCFAGHDRTSLGDGCRLAVITLISLLVGCGDPDCHVPRYGEAGAVRTLRHVAGRVPRRESDAGASHFLTTRCGRIPRAASDACPGGNLEPRRPR
jgi:hypothetical protein